MMKINSTAELSLESFNDLIAENYIYEITIQDDKNYPKGKTYDLFNLFAIKRAIVDFLKDCPQYDSHNPHTEKDIFSYIYTKLALTVEYDDLASKAIHSSPEFKQLYAADYIDQSAGLDSTMISKRALCSGFAETLRNLLAEKGIEAKYVSGTSKPNPTTGKTSSHAWNQVKLDGEWFNCDVTHDQKFIKEGLVAPNFLKSNVQFSNYTKYPIRITNKIEPATHSISTHDQQILIGNHYNHILKEITAKTAETDKKQPGFFKSILKKLHIIKSTEPEK